MTVRLAELDTPALVVDHDRLERNLQPVEQAVARAGKHYVWVAENDHVVDDGPITTRGAAT
jgi:D-serine deaminase-like pyridoxal phosphate-dependent protein